MATVPSDSFSIPQELWFEELSPGYPVIKIDNRHAKATIALLGATLIEYTPTGSQPIIFTSSKAIFQEGKAIRGGIPVCWPWFGPHPSDNSKPNHGFARDRFWELKSTTKHEDYTEVTLEFDTRQVANELWPQHTTAEITFRIGQALDVQLTSCNRSDSSITIGGALHTYFDIAHISDVSVIGLDGVTFADKVTNKHGTQSGALSFTKETDLVFEKTMATTTIDDRGNSRQIHVAKNGSRSTVVWNPWIEKSAGMGDLGNEDYLSFVCVETANAFDDVYTLEPGAIHTLGTTITVNTSLS
ncbi:glucose-6-phosphate 1-epimerase [Rubritalea squalenifaciens DSM 18772]|uniref:Putative glucose-6-phosphate 1-epimerase n=1 Tax=Rubritalea squalenifaciens DSM 18772 TaxID=1123071 RepID=A0A1M6P436_9BACT|nr:D-hexose-6-phosphate mutarotase [Rubritalea squalenifaciens]SHK02653.1 glucose-6-phosphate 1-epimerase [Rubritalea squalenifaciens DSM 18772]